MNPEWNGVEDYVESSLERRAREVRESESPWRKAVAILSVPWRQRWAGLTATLLDEDYPEADAERLAWEQVRREIATCPEPDMPPVGPPAAGLTAEVPWRCDNRSCAGGGWWMGPWGTLMCRSCVPPAFPSLVVTEGPAANPPLVFASDTTTAVNQELCIAYRRRIAEEN